MRKSIPTYSIGRIALAGGIGFSIDFSKRLLEPVFGPFDLPFKFVWAVLYSGGCVLICMVMGLVLMLPLVNRAWNSHKILFWSMIGVGVALFQVGVIKAHHTYFGPSGDGDVANWYLDYLTRPGYLMILFALCFRPIRERQPVSLSAPAESTIVPNREEENNLDRWMRKREQ